MPEFTIRFLKRVSNDAGREKEMCQHLLNVEATDAAQAIFAAQQQFCQLERIPDWTARADRFELFLSDLTDDALSRGGAAQGP